MINLFPMTEAFCRDIPLKFYFEKRQKLNFLNIFSAWNIHSFCYKQKKICFNLFKRGKFAIARIFFFLGVNLLKKCVFCFSSGGNSLKCQKLSLIRKKIKPNNHQPNNSLRDILFWERSGSCFLQWLPPDDFSGARILFFDLGNASMALKCVTP